MQIWGKEKTEYVCFHYLSKQSLKSISLIFLNQLVQNNGKQSSLIFKSQIISMNLAIWLIHKLTRISTLQGVWAIYTFNYLYGC